MRKFLLAAALILSASLTAAQDVQRVPLAIAWDLDGLGVDADYNVLATALNDAGVYAISAQNEVCRVNNLTIVDADSSVTAGVVTVTGTDCWGDALACTFTFTGAGSGAKSLVYSSGAAKTCAFKTITSVTNGALTGEGGAGDTMSVGYPAVSGYVYPIYGVRQADSNGHRFINPFAMARAVDDVTVNGTALASFTTADGGAFQNLAIGDLIYLTYAGKQFERRLVDVASDDAATMDAALPTATDPATDARIRMDYKKRYLFREDQDGWVPLGGRDLVFSMVDVDANANTGGVISSVECAAEFGFTSTPFDPIVRMATDTVASGATANNMDSIDGRLHPWTHCRIGVQFGTGDDADVANEDINIFLFTREDN